MATVLDSTSLEWYIPSRCFRDCWFSALDYCLIPYKERSPFLPTPPLLYRDSIRDKTMGNKYIVVQIPEVIFLSNIGLIFFFFFFLIYFWMHWVFIAACGLSLVVASGGYSLLRWAGFSLQLLLLLWSTGSRHVGSVVVAHGLSCSMACGIFPDQGLNPCLLHWQVDS